MTIFAKPVVAIIFGAFIFCAETCLHADTLLRVAEAPFELPFYDWIAAGFLILAGALTHRASTDVRRQYQAVAWAFMLSLLTGAFLSMLAEWWLQGSAERQHHLVPPVLVSRRRAWWLSI